MGRGCEEREEKARCGAMGDEKGRDWSSREDGRLKEPKETALIHREGGGERPQIA